MRVAVARRALRGALLYAAAGAALAGGLPEAPAEAPAGKRIAALVVAPVTLHGVRYTAPAGMRGYGDDQEGGYVVAHERRSGRELWRVRVYATAYDAHLEQDVQDVYIEALRPGRGGRTLEVIDERNRRHTLDLATRTIRAH